MDSLTIDDVLLWLNDRLGKSVHVEVQVERGDLSITVLEAEGVLEHWSERASSHDLNVPHEARTRFVRQLRRVLSRQSVDLAGWYAIGDAHFDLSELDHLGGIVEAYGGIDIPLAPEVDAPHRRAGGTIRIRVAAATGEGYGGTPSSRAGRARREQVGGCSSEGGAPAAGPRG